MAYHLSVGRSPLLRLPLALCTGLNRDDCRRRQHSLGNDFSSESLAHYELTSLSRVVQSTP
jgi:hypothetical protein